MPGDLAVTPRGCEHCSGAIAGANRQLYWPLWQAGSPSVGRLGGLRGLGPQHRAAPAAEGGAAAEPLAAGAAAATRQRRRRLNGPQSPRPRNRLDYRWVVPSLPSGETTANPLHPQAVDGHTRHDRRRIVVLVDEGSELGEAAD